MIGSAERAKWKDLQDQQALAFVMVGGRFCCSRSWHRMAWHVVVGGLGVGDLVLDVWGLFFVFVSVHFVGVVGMVWMEGG